MNVRYHQKFRVRKTTLLNHGIIVMSNDSERKAFQDWYIIYQRDWSRIQAEAPDSLVAWDAWKARALMGVVIDRSKPDGNTGTLETDALTIDHAALFKAFAQDVVKHANNILSNYTLTRLQYPDDLIEHWLTYLPSEYSDNTK